MATIVPVRLRSRVLVRPMVPLAFLAAGGGWQYIAPGNAGPALLWRVGLVLCALPVLWRMTRGILAGRFAADIVAALAVVGALAFNQSIAGLVVLVMLLGGEALERYAEGRASLALQRLQQGAPRTAHVLRASSSDGSSQVLDVNTGDVGIGDRLLVRPGEVVPCDGVVLEGRSSLDTSTITGEPMPTNGVPGVAVASGWINGEGALVVRTVALASESQYERIVALVRSAQASKSPLQRAADRYAVWFTPFTLLMCGLAYLVSHDPIRVLAVLVVATPCPLILATPIAIIGGIDRAARSQVIMRNGSALERLAAVRTAIFDKTGTLTVGRPTVGRVIVTTERSEGEVLQLAAAVEQGSSHLLARTLVEAATSTGTPLPGATEIAESPGRGVEGMVAGHRVTVGALSFVVERRPATRIQFEQLSRDVTGLFAGVAIDDEAAGLIIYADQLRPGVAEFIGRLRAVGISHTVLLSGDREANVRAVGQACGIDEVHGDLLPAEKEAVVGQRVDQGEAVLMVGDGTNDAPALARATVGIALAGHANASVTAETADVVILNDDVTRVADAVTIGQRTMRIARQSMRAGLALSACAMLAAIAGEVRPVGGAMLQEAIDVAVIVNALRAARNPG